MTTTTTTTTRTAAPATDEDAIRQILRALRLAGYGLITVDNGEERIPVRTDDAAFAAINEVDNASLRVVHNVRAASVGYVWFVLGNEPFEVAADYSANLAPVIEPLTDRWT